MENLAHTLFGLTLAKAGLERVTPLAATTLVISSNLPDADVVMRLRGGALSYIEHHRGLTHSFVGLVALAAGLTLILVYLDRKFRLRRDPFRRPIRPWRIFILACVGGLGHLFLDFTNTYGVRPLLPFSRRWFYGDIAFIVDPWIWLILGSAVVWLMPKDALRAAVWLVIGVTLSIIMALAFHEPSEELPVAIPITVRVIWFAGLFVIVFGLLLGWSRAGGRLARASLFVLALYYGGMWIAQQTAIGQTAASPPAAPVTSGAAWPTPANPLLWQRVASTDENIFISYANVLDPRGGWRDLPALDYRFVEPLRSYETSRKFLEFARYASARVEEREDGYRLALRDIRFPLRMNVVLDRDLVVQSAEVFGF